MKHFRDFAEVAIFTVIACAILTLALSFDNPLNMNMWDFYLDFILLALPACLIITLLFKIWSMWK